MKIRFAPSGAAALCVLLGCTSPQTPNASLDARPPLTFQVSEQRRQELLTKVKDVKAGMKPDEIFALLGKPTYDDQVGPKSPDAPQHFHRVLRYYLKQYGGGGNSADELITVGFTENQKVEYVAVQPPGAQ